MDSRWSTSQESISTVNSDASSRDGQEAELHRKDSAVSEVSDESHGNEASENFVQDAAGSIFDSLQKGHSQSTIQLELQAQRMAADATAHQVRKAVVRGLVRHMSESKKAGRLPKEVLSANREIIERTLFDSSDAQKSDQVDFLLLVQGDLAKRADGDTLLKSICYDLYMLDDFEKDLFDVDAFKQWWQDKRSTETQDMKSVRQRTAVVMEAIEENEDEEDDDEDEEEDSGSSE